MDFDHQQAVITHAVERYLLGELPSPLREAFEDHYFSCPQCAEALRVGSMLRENVRTLFRTSPQPDAAVSAAVVPIGTAAAEQANIRHAGVPAENSLGWRTWMRASILVPWAAALLFFGVAVRPRPDSMHSPVESAMFLNLHAGARGAAQSLAPAVSLRGMLTLAVDVPSNIAYHWSLRLEKSLASDPPAYQGAVLASNGTLAVSVDARRLKAGEYVLDIAPAGEENAATEFQDGGSGRSYQFVLKAEPQ